MGNLIQMFVPKQTDINERPKVIQRKVLKGTHLFVEIKKFKPDTQLVLISKIFIYICLRINYPLPKQQLEK